MALDLGVLSAMLSDILKSKLIISHSEDRNLNIQRGFKTAGHVFVGDTIFFLELLPLGEITPSL